MTYHRPLRTSRGSAWYLLGITALIAVVAAVIVFAVIRHNDQAKACRDAGGTVVREVEQKTRTVTRNGKQIRETYNEVEHECVRDGRELFEW